MSSASVTAGSGPANAELLSSLAAALQLAAIKTTEQPALQAPVLQQIKHSKPFAEGVQSTQWLSAELVRNCLVAAESAYECLQPLDAHTKVKEKILHSSGHTLDTKTLRVAPSQHPEPLEAPELCWMCCNRKWLKMEPHLVVALQPSEKQQGHSSSIGNGSSCTSSTPSACSRGGAVDAAGAWANTDGTAAASAFGLGAQTIIIAFPGTQVTKDYLTDIRWVPSGVLVT
jgi:hypothetical protein